MKIKVIDIIDNVGGYGMGETVRFELDGEPVRYERWFTDNSGGADFYKGATSDQWTLEDPDVEDDGWEEREHAVRDYLDDVLNEYAKQYEKVVNPATEVAVENTKAIAEAMLDEPQYEGLEYA